MDNKTKLFIESKAVEVLKTLKGTYSFLEESSLHMGESLEIEVRGVRIRASILLGLLPGDNYPKLDVFLMATKLKKENIPQLRLMAYLCLWEKGVLRSMFFLQAIKHHFYSDITEYSKEDVDILLKPLFLELEGGR